MRTMLHIVIPVETGNRAIKDGSLPKLIESFSQKFKPEAAYFFAFQGKRSAFFVFDLPDSSHIPPVAESFFFTLDAEVYATPVMNLDDLRTGLQKMMQS